MFLDRMGFEPGWTAQTDLERDTLKPYLFYYNVHSCDDKFVTNRSKCKVIDGHLRSLMATHKHEESLNISKNVSKVIKAWRQNRRTTLFMLQCVRHKHSLTHAERERDRRRCFVKADSFTYEGKDAVVIEPLPKRWRLQFESSCFRECFQPWKLLYVQFTRSWWEIDNSQFIFLKYLLC